MLIRISLAAILISLSVSVWSHEYDDFDYFSDQPAAKAALPSIVEKWAEGLESPQGIAQFENHILVAENGKNRILRFPLEGGAFSVYAEGLKAPSWIALCEDTLYVSERKGNSIARVDATGKVQRLNGEVVDPLGIILTPGEPGDVMVVSHVQSVLQHFVWDKEALQHRLKPEPAAIAHEGMTYGWRDVARAKDGTIYITDELTRSVLRKQPGGKLEGWVGNLAGPSAVVICPDEKVYVTEEGYGRLSRIEADGSLTPIAEGLGMARAVQFIDDRILLVTDRDGGNIWRVTLE